jgi:hypothetical protein
MNYDLVLTCMAAFLKMEADNVPLTAGEAKVGTGETDLGTGIDLTDFLLVAQIGVEGKYCSGLSNYLQDCLLAIICFMKIQRE